MEKIKEQYELDPELLSGFLDESEESLASLDGLFVELERKPKDKEIIGSIFRVAHSIKGLAACLGLINIKELTHELETVLANIRDDKLAATASRIDVLLKGFDEVKNMIHRVRVSEPEIADENTFRQLVEQIKQIAVDSAQDEKEINKTSASVPENLNETSAKENKPEEEIANSKSQPFETAKKSSTKDAGRTMRVSEEKVDMFMQYVGDLIEVSEAFNLLQKRIENISDIQLSKEFKAINSGFNQLSEKLQKSLLEIRKVPAKSLFQKIPRMARELAQSFGKSIEVKITGEDIQIDKSLIEAMESPLNHLVRNCLDHGIELPEIRKQNGKCETGTIKISMTEQGDNVVIEIKDDGGGINPRKIRDKAVRMRLVNPSQADAMSDKDVLKFLFHSGFSTADKVTEVSGRGVGMDVVMTNVRSLKGTIDLQSIFGQGTTVTLRLPSSLTVVVVSGMLVGAGSEQYIIKLEDIKESLRPRASEVITAGGKAEYLNVRGSIYPLLRLNRVFGIESKLTNPSEAMAIVVQGKEKSAAILLDNILGQQRIVAKELGQQFSGLKTISGTAILANGRVGLILDVNGIIEQFLGGRKVAAG